MSILFTIVSIGFVVFIHELGHLIAAKRAKVGVTEFAVGMGPKIWSFNYQDTMYSLRLLPVGGFIKAKGLDDLEDCPIEQDYREKSILARASIIVAGSLMNLILGCVIFCVFGAMIGEPSVHNEIEQVMDNYPAAINGLQPGDKIVKVNNYPIQNITTDFINVVKASKGESISIVYQRNNEMNTIDLSAIPSESNQYVIGVSFKVINIPLSFLDALQYGVKQTVFTIHQSMVGLKLLISGQASINDLAGPVGIIQFASSQFSSGIYSFFSFMAFISISLGVINLFPIPVLDGGHLLFLLIEAIRRKPLNKKIELALHNTAAVLLITLMCFTVFNDVTKWNERVDIIKELNK